MKHTKEAHSNFLEAELNAQTESFRQKLDTNAISLLSDKGELYVAQFLKLENGEMILIFSNVGGIPRQGEYLYCMLCPKDLRNYKNWGSMSYGDLVRAKTDFSEIVCIWQSPAENKNYTLVGFRGLDIEFAQVLKGAERVILILGPNKPPFEYIKNLNEIVVSNNCYSDAMLERNFLQPSTSSIPLSVGTNVTAFIEGQLQLSDEVIIQGPPGTGKTYLISELCTALTAKGKTVLVTALTNRALVEIAGKEPLKTQLCEGKIYKTKITVDESLLLPDLKSIKEINPISGGILLSTFFITSSRAKDCLAPIFDYVIVDEASQALLGMLAAVKRLGKRVIYIGDVKQLPPVVSLSDDVIQRKGYNYLVDGFKAISSLPSIPNFQITASHRLQERAAQYTSLFYNTPLQSFSKKKPLFNSLTTDLKQLLHCMGGPVLIKTDLEIGNFKPKKALFLSTALISSICETNPDINIAVLTYFKETTKALQCAIYQTIGYKKNVLIETVSRVQGLTTDICIYVVPNTSYHRSLENRLFNVATSRAKQHTIIIADYDILNSTVIDLDVRRYLQLLDLEKSIVVGSNKVRSLE